MTCYFVSGHGDISDAEFNEHYVPRLEKAVINDGTFVVGDFRGVDVKAQRWLSVAEADVTVYHMFDMPRFNPGYNPTAGGFQTDEERDAAMTAVSDQDIAWVRPGKEKSGTAKNLARRTAILV